MLFFTLGANGVALDAGSSQIGICTDLYRLRFWRSRLWDTECRHATTAIGAGTSDESASNPWLYDHRYYSVGWPISLLLKVLHSTLRALRPEFQKAPRRS